MQNLVRISKVNAKPGFPLRASTLYKWVHTRKHLDLFVRLGGAVFVNLDRFDELIENGGTCGSGKASPANRFPMNRKQKAHG